MGREPKLTVVCGKKGIGKTVKTIGVIREYVRGNPAAGIRGRPALIIDPNNEYADKAIYPDVRALPLEQVQRFAAKGVLYPEIRRIAPFHSDNTRMTLDELVEVLKWVLYNYFNGLILIEDVNKYISDSTPNDVIGALCTQRHSGVDVIIQYQHVGRISPKIWGNVNILRLHKYTGSIDRHYDKLEDMYEFMKIAENIVNLKFMQGDIRFFLYVDIDAEKIMGAFSDEDYRQAVETYVYENYSKLIKPYTNRVNDMGKKVYTPQTAIAEIIERLMNAYR